MNKIKLKHMKVRNFKGFKEFELLADGNNLKIYGDNATGKTSVFDAFSWALFGKDSKDSANFAWKPLDKDNKEINHLETEVDLHLDINGTALQLTRTISEKWTRKRGSDSTSFEGHETQYRIDGVKTTLAKYKKRIEEAISEDTFKQLTNVYYVAETMKSKDRRELLFSLVEEVTDQEVINSNEELKPLESILDGRSVDDKRQLITEERRNVKRDLDRIPDRIDEVDRSIPDLSTIDQDKLNEQLNELSQLIQAKEEEIASFSNGDQLTHLRSSLKAKEMEIQALRSDYKLKMNESLDHLQGMRQEVRERLQTAEDELESEQRKLSRVKYDKETNEKQIQSILNRIDSLRSEFSEVRKEEYPEFDEHKKTCALCGQDYPEEQQEEMLQNYEKEKAGFNADKAKRLEDINSLGKELKEQLKELMKDTEEKELILTVKNDVHALEKKKRDIQKELQGIDKELQRAKEQRTPFELTEEYKAVDKEIESLEKDLDALLRGNEKQIEEKRTDLNDLKQSREKIQDQLYQFKLAEKQELRKQELIAEEKKLSSRYGELENHLYLLDEFVRAKVSMLTDRINNQFEIVEFKLFEEQINGGLKEVCEPLVDGVPFSSGLNSAARINAGLDIINTLSRLEGISAPIFIDNSESITKLIDTAAQTIQLIVTEGQKELKVETKTLEGAL